jgi:hypothetical protein
MTAFALSRPKAVGRLCPNNGHCDCLPSALVAQLDIDDVLDSLAARPADPPHPTFMIFVKLDRLSDQRFPVVRAHPPRLRREDERHGAQRRISRSTASGTPSPTRFDEKGDQMRCWDRFWDTQRGRSRRTMAPSLRETLLNARRWSKKSTIRNSTVFWQHVAPKTDASAQTTSRRSDSPTHAGHLGGKPRVKVLVPKRLPE